MLLISVHLALSYFHIPQINHYWYWCFIQLNAYLTHCLQTSIFASSSYIPLFLNSVLFIISPNFEAIIPHSSDFYCCCWKFCCHANHHSGLVNCASFLLPSKTLSLCYILCCFARMAIFFSLLGIRCASRMWIQVFHWCWKLHSPYFFQFCPSLGLFFEMPIIYIVCVCVCVRVNLAFQVCPL